MTMPCPDDKHLSGLGREQLIAMLKAKWSEADKTSADVTELSVFVLGIHAGYTTVTPGVKPVGNGAIAIDLEGIRLANRGKVPDA